MHPTVINLLGEKFGKLLVIEFCGTQSTTGKSTKRARWKCRCDCGNITIVDSSNLRSGRMIGCGKCRETIGNQYGKYNLKTYDSAFNIFYNTVKRGAIQRRFSFELNPNDVKTISRQNCFYCGIEPHQIIKARNNFGSDFIYNGIDRVDNTKGYTINNCVPCCKKCNQAKMNLPVEQFKSLVISIYKNWASK